MIFPQISKILFYETIRRKYHWRKAGKEDRIKFPERNVIKINIIKLK